MATFPPQNLTGSSDPAHSSTPLDLPTPPRVPVPRTPQRTVGVEEELLLVDPASGRPVALATKVIRRSHTLLASSEVADGVEPTDEPGGTVTKELKQEQVETDTPPRTDLDHLEADLRRMRAVVAAAARDAGAAVVAAGTSPVAVVPELVPDERYEAMVQHVGITAVEHLTCGCHVHVGVASDDEGVVALNGIRPWLPVLLAYSANSPYHQGRDTGYASYRAQLMARWPGTGPHELFTSGAQYRETAEKMVATGVLLDSGMLYFDARLSARYPTLELRVADVCPDVRDAVVLAALARALVDTAVAEHAAGVPPEPVPTPLMRLATWQASGPGWAATSSTRSPATRGRRRTSSPCCSPTYVRRCARTATWPGSRPERLRCWRPARARTASARSSTVRTASPPSSRTWSSPPARGPDRTRWHSDASRGQPHGGVERGERGGGSWDGHTQFRSSPRQTMNKTSTLDPSAGRRAPNPL